MPYRYLDEEATADVAFEAWGADPEEVFRAAADAVVNVQIDRLESVVARERRTFELRNEALDLLLFEFLNRLIYYKDAEQLLLRVPDVQLRKDGQGWHCLATGQGEPIDPKRHEQIVDVKAVTLHHFRLEETPEGWTAHVILDI